MSDLSIDAGRGRFWLAVSFCLVAFNLRGALTAVAPVLPEIMRDTGLGTAGAGAITTIPLLCLGLLAPIAPWLSRRYGAERAVVILMLTTAAGAALRSPGSPAALWGSGVLLGGGIGMTNVLLPSMIKRDFADRTALMIGLYTMMLCISAALGQAISVPLSALAGGWPAALAWWALPAAIAAAMLTEQLRSPARRLLTEAGDVPFRGLWLHPMAWQISLFMALQSSFTFVIFAWLPPLLRERGFDPVTAGVITAVSTAAQTVSGLFGPTIAARMRDQRAGGLICFVLGLGGFLACRYLPLTLIWPSAIIMGLGQGAMFAVALILLVLRAPSPAVTAQLSSMAQTVGYLMAAAAPMLVGVAHDWTGDWSMVTPLMMVIALSGTLCCWFAGRARVIAPGGMTP